MRFRELILKIFKNWRILSVKIFLSLGSGNLSLRLKQGNLHCNKISDFTVIITRCNGIFYEFQILTSEVLADVVLVQRDRNETESQGYRNLFQHYCKRLLNGPQRRRILITHERRRHAMYV